MTTEIHRYRHSRDVRRVHLDVHTQGGDSAPETLRSDAEVVDKVDDEER